VLREVLYSEDFNLLRSSFLEMLGKARLHITDESSATDFDVTFMQHGVAASALNENLLHLAGASINALTLLSKNLIDSVEESDSKPKDAHAADYNLKNFAFTNIPELREPNNHYMLLLVIAEVLNARNVVEVGTASGSSLCSFLSSPNVECVTTFDLVPLAANRAWLTPKSLAIVDKFLDHNRERWSQHVVDLSSESTWIEYSSVFAEADIIFIDADHSGSFESILAMRLEKLLKPHTVVIWDDIRVSSMVNFWQKLNMNKMEFTGIGHYSGTGVSQLRLPN